MTNSELKEWININQVVNRSMNNFWTYIKNYQEEDKEDFSDTFKNLDISLVQLSLDKISLTLNYRFDEVIEYVVVKINLLFNEEGKGFYECLFTLEGEDMDDYLTITA